MYPCVSSTCVQRVLPMGTIINMFCDGEVASKDHTGPYRTCELRPNPTQNISICGITKMFQILPIPLLLQCRLTVQCSHLVCYCRVLLTNMKVAVPKNQGQAVFRLPGFTFEDFDASGWCTLLHLPSLFSA